jgi:hypothetical protein
MTTIKSFINRLRKIGVEVELFGNYPWVYLDKVNGKKVRGTFQGEHGFTAFFLPSNPGEKETITSIPVIFNKIRETLKEK